MRADLRAALTSAARLIHDGKPAAAVRMLDEIIAEHRGDPIVATAGSLRDLCSASAEHLRLADEMDAAARGHRLAAHELESSLDAVLARWRYEVEAHHGGSRMPRPIPFRSPPWPSTTDVVPDPGGGMAEPSAPPAARESEADVCVRVLGPFEVSVAGLPIGRWPSLKARGLFQYLVLHSGRPVRRELLMELFWPSHSHRSARNNLNVSLYSLRQTLQHDVQDRHHIVYQHGCYFTNPELGWWIDEAEFLARVRDAGRTEGTGRGRQAIDGYQRAVDLYRGPLLEDDSTCEWHLPERRHLQEAYLRALDRLGELSLEVGDLGRAVQAAELALTTDRCRESAHRLLMRCYARQHQQHLVSRQLRLCVTTLREDLGVAASSLTFSLFEQLTGDG